MTVQEFSNEFDILYNNIMSNLAPGLDAYEKSVFLTLAQEDVVKAYYLGSSTGIGPFENTEAVRRSLAELVETKGYSYKSDSTEETLPKELKFNLDPNVWFIVQEYFKDKDNNIIDVIPAQYDELSKLRKNPFRGPSKNRILRTDYNGNSVKLYTAGNINIDIDEENQVYFVTFVKQPEPIILEDLGTSLSINNKNTASPCLLHSSIHRLILTQAVALAAAAYKS